MKQFPRTMVGGISLPRMLIGTNWVLGYSHRSPTADEMIRSRFATKEAVCDLVSAYLPYGIDAMMAPFIDEECKPKQVLMDGIHMAEDRMNKKVILIETPIIDVADKPEAHDYSARKIEAARKNGADFCLIHQCNTDALANKNTGEITRLAEYTKMIRDNGMVPGLSTHLPEVIQLADAHPEYDVQTYIQLYNCMGFLMQLEIEGVRRIIENAKKPVMTIKAMAAGRCTPYVGLSFSYATLRDCDMVTVGAHTPGEVHEDVEIAMAALERRFPDLDKHTLT